MMSSSGVRVIFVTRSKLQSRVPPIPHYCLSNNKKLNETKVGDSLVRWCYRIMTLRWTISQVITTKSRWKRKNSTDCVQLYTYTKTFHFLLLLRGGGGEKNLESCEKPQALDWATENSISCPPPLKHFIFHSFWRTGRFVFLFNEEYRHVVCFLERGVDSYRGWDSARTRRTQRNCGMRRLGRRSSKQSHDGWNAALFRKQTISLTK